MRKFLGKFLVLLSLIIVVFIVFLSFNKKDNRYEVINKLLKTENYSYLPEEAKEYIKEIYGETGEIILTEKNKKVNTPYLNPQYVSYLSLDEEEKEEVDVIPDAFSLDYTPQTFDDINDMQMSYSSTYNLSNVGGNSFITPLKNQESLGICWAFSTIEQAESYLMVTNNMPYNSSFELLSPRQLDYAASSNGINYYDNDFGYRNLGDGGNFYMSSFILSNGVSLVPEEYMPFSNDLDGKELVEVLNYGNSLYEVDSTIMMPTLDDGYTSSALDNYIQTIKGYIMQYGGAYVGTGSPQGACGSKNTDGRYIISDTSDCNSNSNYSGHAMQIIGWDDNYNYSYCLSGTNHYNVNNSGRCNTGSLVSGTGAWIIRNSWGNDPDYDYVYLSYNSTNTDIDFITSLSDMQSRTWDNNYHNNPWGSNSGMYSIVDAATFNKKISGPEKLEKIKFMSLSQNGTYNITVRVGSTNYYNIASVSNVMPGIVTVDLSSKNINIDSDSFTVMVMSSNGTYVLMNTISAFTSNTTSTPLIKTEDMIVDGILDEYIGIVLYSDTKNISSNEEVTYSLWKGSTNYSSYLEDVFYNYVAENNLNTYLFIDSSIPSGDYRIGTTYGGYTYYSNLKINGASITEGSGTKNDPYIIYNESQLSAMKYNLSAAYKLGSDITLTEPWIPVGTESEPFKGIFDGDGHTINGLVVNNGATYNGLFGYVEGNTSSDFSIIKNVTIKDASVGGNSDTGILIGHLNIGDSEYAKVFNVNIIGGEVTSTGNAGSILGNFTSIITANTVYMYQIFSSATISGSTTSGIIGNLDEFADLKMYLFENIGDVKVSGSVDNYHNGIVGKFHNDVMWMEFYDFIVTNRNYFNTTYNGHILEKRITNTRGKYNKSGIYLKTSNDTITFDLQTANGNVYNITDITALKDDNIKSNFQNDFDTYFKVEEIDGIKRIPILKGVNIEYTSIDDIELEVGDTVSLLDYITPTTDATRIHVTTLENENKVSVNYEYDSGVNYPKDIKITALRRGTTTIHVVSDYDGYENDITITNTGGNVAVTKPDGTIEEYPYNSTYNLGTNNMSKADTVISTVTLKYQNGSSIDGSLDVIKSYTPNGWLVNGEVVTNNTVLTLTDDVVIEYNYLENVTSPSFPILSRSNYTFLGWFDDSTGGSEVTSYTGDTNITVYAHWRPDYINVTMPDNTVNVYNYGYNYNLGVNNSIKSNQNGATITLKYQDGREDSTIYVIKSYDADGWIVNNEYYADNAEITLTEDIVINYNYIESISSPEFPEPTREHYIFQGWFDDPEAGSTVTSYSGSDNIVLYAQWLGEEINVTKPDNSLEVKHYGDTYNLGINDINKANENGATITLKYLDGREDGTLNVIKSYTPNGWLVNGLEKEDNEVLTLIEDIVINYNYSETLISPEFPEPTRENYTFLGWYNLAENGELVESYNGLNDITLFAYWNLDKPSDFEVDNNNLLLSIGDIHQIEVTFTPVGTTDDFIYSGYNDEVISVVDGLITALAPGETTINVSLDSNNEVTKTISIKVIYDEIISNSLDVETKDLDRIVIGEEPNIKLEDFLAKFENDSTYIKVYTEDDELIEDMNTIVSTGMKLKLTVNNQVIDEVVVIVRGDIDGDGMVNIIDAGLMKQHIIEAQPIEGFRLYAADLEIEPEATIENMINVLDSGKLKSYIIESIDSLN